MESGGEMIVSMTKTYYGVECDVCHRFTAWYDSSIDMAIEIAQLEYGFVQADGWPKGTMLCPECKQRGKRPGELR